MQEGHQRRKGGHKDQDEGGSLNECQMLGEGEGGRRGGGAPLARG